MIFGQGHPEKVIDYGHRAMHVMTTSAKLVIRNATGRFAERSYFVGCSAGGHQAMSEAQRYPGRLRRHCRRRSRQQPDPADLRLPVVVDGDARADGTPLLTQPKLALLTTSAVAACDANDGLKDGLIDDPRRCTFDPATLACKAGADDATCLTRAAGRGGPADVRGHQEPAHRRS